jgi:hypothetical protein
MTRTQVGRLVADRRRNAYAAWSVVLFLGAVLVGSALSGRVVWALFVAGLLALAVVPPAAYRTPTVMLPWEVLVVAALPVIGRSVARVPLTSRVATYLSVAAVALVVAVELHAFTSVRMSYGFAVVFVVVTTMATAGAWAVTRWAVEVLLGVPALYPALDTEATHTAVNWEFVASAVAGLAGGAVFELYFRRLSGVTERLPDAVEEFA